MSDETGKELPKASLIEEVKAESDSATESVTAAESPASSDASSPSSSTESGAAEALDPEAKAKANEEARAARAAARAAKAAAEAEAEAEVPKEPSPKQPELDAIVHVLKEMLSDDVVEEAWINDKDGDMPSLSIHSKHWYEAAIVLRDHPELGYNYLRNVTGIDQETHLEAGFHILSLTSKRNVYVRVKADREQPSIPSATPVWETANWNEREIYDLLGIEFTGHPNLTRIMMPDDWVGHPIRKDYEPLDPEV